MRIRTILVNALLKSQPGGTYDHLTLRELAREYITLDVCAPIEIEAWLLALDVWHNRKGYLEA